LVFETVRPLSILKKKSYFCANKIIKISEMILKFEDLDPNATYSFADYLTWQFQERVELIRGKLFKMAMPSEKHQRVSGNLHGLFWSYLHKKRCKVYHPPFDVRLEKPFHLRKTKDKSILTVVQPDITVVCDIEKIDNKGCAGAPDLIVEILSPSTGGKDLKDKKEVYEFSEVPEYWIVHPNDQTVIVYILNDQKKYVVDNVYAATDIIKVSIFDDLNIDLSDVFEDY
jgi:Uma2 family endonuclease